MAFDIDEVFPWELAQKWVIRMQQLERAGFFEGDEYDLIIKHGQHNQKAHGSRYGAGQAKESLRRLKDDKQARERYKANARKRGQGSGSDPTRPFSKEEIDKASDRKATRASIDVLETLGIANNPDGTAYITNDKKGGRMLGGLVEGNPPPKPKYRNRAEADRYRQQTAKRAAELARQKTKENMAKTPPKERERARSLPSVFDLD